MKLCKNLQINGETGHASAHCLKRRQDIETIYIIPELCVLPQSWGLPDLLTVLLIAEEIKIDNQKMSWIYTHCEINKQEKKKVCPEDHTGIIVFFFLIDLYCICCPLCPYIISRRYNRMTTVTLSVEFLKLWKQTTLE